MKKSEKENLLRRIANFCKKYKIKGSYNNEFENKLISFGVKDKK